MIETKVSLRHDTQAAIRSYLDNASYPNNDTIVDGVINIINMISDYHEEGTALFPDVVMINSSKFFETFPSKKIRLHEGVLDAVDFSMAVKMGAPLALESWVIYIMIGEENQVEYGVMTASLTQMSVSLYDQTITTPKSQCSAIYLRNIGNKIVELCCNGAQCSISLNLVESELKLNSVIEQLVSNILCDSSITNIPNLIELSGYMQRLIVDALNSGHGNLIAVTEDVVALEATKGLKGGVYVEPVIDFVNLSLANLEEGSDCSATTMQKYYSIVKSMINFDGITLFDTKGCVIGYHFIVDNNLIEEQRIVGGSRTRAFVALSNLDGIKSCFMKSQDGNLKFVCK